MSIPAAFLTARPAASAAGRPGAGTPDDGGTGFGSVLQAAVAGEGPATGPAAQSPETVPAETPEAASLETVPESSAQPVPSVPGFSFPAQDTGAELLAGSGEPGGPALPATGETGGATAEDEPGGETGAGRMPGSTDAAASPAVPGSTATSVPVPAHVSGTGDVPPSPSAEPQVGRHGAEPESKDTRQVTSAAGTHAGAAALAAAPVEGAGAANPDRVQGGETPAAPVASTGPDASTAQAPNAAGAATTPAALPAPHATGASGESALAAKPASGTVQATGNPAASPAAGAGQPPAASPAMDVEPAPPGAPAVYTSSAGIQHIQPAPVQGMAAAAAPAAAAQPAPLFTQVAQPLFSLTSAAPGNHVMTLSVTPENLGPVTVRAHVSADGIRVELFAPNDAGREALRTILTDLRRDLSGSGLSTSLSLSAQDQPGAGADSRGGAGQELPGSGHPGTARGSQPDPGPAPVQQAFRPVAHGSASTLDILA